MHTAGEMGSSAVPAFLTKLWTLVEDESTNDLICWDPHGMSFHLYEQGRFAKEVLPYYFKHNNIASFIRQLNMYGFRKVVSIESGGLKTERDDIEFSHPYFIRGQENLLEFIKRKVPTGSVKKEGSKSAPMEVDTLLNDVKQIRGKQDSMTSNLNLLKRENEALWREVASLRQKHTKQQQVVNRLIQFLLTLVGNRGVAPNMKRKMPLMINDAAHNEPASKLPKITAQYTVDESIPGPSKISAPSAKGRGPTIYDITDLEGASGDGQEVKPTYIQEVFSPPDPLHTDPVGSLDMLTGSQFASSPMSAAATNTILSVNTSQGHLSSARTHPPLSLSSGVTSRQVPLSSSLNITNTSPVKSEKREPTTSHMAASMAASDYGLPSQSQTTTPITNLLYTPAPTPAQDASSLLHVKQPDLVKTDMLDHLDTLQSDLDSLKDLLSSGQYNLDASQLLGMFQDEAGGSGSSNLNDLQDIPVMLNATNTTADSSNFITGNELITYNPQDQDISSLYDSTDLSTPNPSVDLTADLNTPLIDYTDETNPLLLGLSGIPEASTSTDEVD